MMMTRNTIFACSLFAVAALAGFGCKDDGGNGPGNPGTGGSNAGSGGAGTAGAGGGAAGTVGSGGSSAGGSGGGTPGFMSVLPCASESAYTSGATTINFGLLSTAGFAYDPKCLKITAGSTVTFSGDFLSHPLEPSALRGAQTGNPITSTSGVPDGGTTKSFTFATPGFYAYYCLVHDSGDSGMFMSGVIWVQ